MKKLFSLVVALYFKHRLSIRNIRINNHKLK